MTTSVRWKVSGAIAIGAIVLLAACGGGSGGAAATGNSYSGPGSKWDTTLNSDGTFSITRRDNIAAPIDFTVAGNYSTLASGFLKLTIGSVPVDNNGNAPAVNDAGYALEVPGYALFVKPIDPTADQVIAMVKAGECPTADFDGNWVMVKNDGDPSDPGRDFFGTFHFDFASMNGTLPVKKALTATFPDVAGGGIPPGATCSDGIMDVTDAVMYLTQGAGAIVHTNAGTPADETDDDFIFALAQKAITNVNNLDGNYVGILFDENASVGSKTESVGLSCTAGVCTGSEINVETGAADPGTVTVNLTGTADAIAPGFITGTISDGAATGNLACMADIDAAGTGKKMMSCVGQSPGDNTQLFNLLLVSN